MRLTTAASLLVLVGTAVAAPAPVQAAGAELNPRLIPITADELADYIARAKDKTADAASPIRDNPAWKELEQPGTGELESPISKAAGDVMRKVVDFLNSLNTSDMSGLRRVSTVRRDSPSAIDSFKAKLKAAPVPDPDATRAQTNPVRRPPDGKKNPPSTGPGALVSGGSQDPVAGLLPRPEWLDQFKHKDKDETPEAGLYPPLPIPGTLGDGVPSSGARRTKVRRRDGGADEADRALDRRFLDLLYIINKKKELAKLEAIEAAKSDPAVVPRGLDLPYWIVSDDHQESPKDKRGFYADEGQDGLIVDADPSTLEQALLEALEGYSPEDTEEFASLLARDDVTSLAPRRYADTLVELLFPGFDKSD